MSSEPFKAPLPPDGYGQMPSHTLVPVQDPTEGTEKQSTADRLGQLARSRYTLINCQEGNPYGIAHGDPVARPLRGDSKSIRAELSSIYYDTYRKTPTSNALADAMVALEGEALRAETRDVHLRVAESHEAVWVDLGDDTGQVLKIEPGHPFKVVDAAACPVVFRRTSLTGKLSRATASDPGDISPLWRYINAEPDDRDLVAAWMVASLLPDIPHPVMVLTGPQGSGKSSATRRIVELLDPGPVPLRQPPRDSESWAVSAVGSWFVALDNVSDVPQWLSDALCRAVTGDGMLRRKLYTDSDVAILTFRRCVLLNGIDLGALRGDLAERALPVSLTAPTRAERRGEQDLNNEWAKDLPTILAGLYSLVSQVLLTLPTVEVRELPRMADFARVLAAYDQVQGTNALPRYLEVHGRLQAEATQSSPLGEAITDQITAPWSGTSRALLGRLNPPTPTPRKWPKGPREVTSEMRRLKPSLEAEGWTVDERRGRTNTVEWELGPPMRDVREVTPATPATPAHPASTGKNAAQRAGDSAGDRQATPADNLQHLHQAPPKTPVITGSAGLAGDAGDETPTTLPGMPTMTTPDEEHRWADELAGPYG